MYKRIANIIFVDLVIGMTENAKPKPTAADAHVMVAEEAPGAADLETATTPVPGFFSSYHKRKRPCRVDGQVTYSELTVRQQMVRYLSMEMDDEQSNPLKFWKVQAESLPDLCRLARQVFVVPATSAPVERIFSHGGIICRQHRASVSDRNLSRIISLKCNRLR